VECFAIITGEKQRKNEKVWKWEYTFLDIETGKKDCLYHNKKINYTPDIIGKLKLTRGDDGFKYYQSFIQDEFRPYKEKEKSLTQLEKDSSQKIEKLDSYFAKKVAGDNPQQLLEIFDALHQIDKDWDKVAKRFGKTGRTMRRWRWKLANWNSVILKKRGRKRIMCEDCFLLLLFLTNSPKHNTKTQEQKSDYIAEEKGHHYSQQVLSYNLRKYSEFTGKRATKRYSEQDLEEIWNFLKKYSWVYFLPNCLAVDEFSVHPGETSRVAWSRRGCIAEVKQKGKKGPNYTLILCVRNVEKGAVVSSKLFKNEKKKIKDKKTGKVKIKKGTDAVDFYNFLKNIELPSLPNNEKYYLLLDNSKIHYTTDELEELGLSMEELAREKNIELVYLPRYTPEINPIELCFNTTRHFTENLPTDTEEELEKSVDKIIDMINQKPLTKYFRHCQEVFSFGKSGH